MPGEFDYVYVKNSEVGRDRISTNIRGFEN